MKQRIVSKYDNKSQVLAYRLLAGLRKKTNLYLVAS